MSNLQSKLKIKDEVWLITVNEVHELSFAYVVPYSKSIECTDPLWHDWDTEPYVPTSDFISSGVASSISPFLLKRKLIDAITNLINRSNLTFFYFKPTSVQRGSIYVNLINVLINKLNGNWTHQVIDNDSFYFTKEN